MYSLDHDIIPDLERKGADAVEAARGFLLLEGAEELVEEVGKEYARRRERQALETVLENAERR